DAEIRTLDDQIDKEKESLLGLRSSLAKTEEKLGQTRATLAGLEKQKSDGVADVRNMNQQLEHSREKLNRSRTERESNAAQREIEELRKLIRDREEEVAKSTAEADVQRRGMEATEAELEKIKSEIGATEGDTEARLGTTEGERQARLGLRGAIVKRLPV